MTNNDQNKVGFSNKWGPTEKANWLSKQQIKRSYYDDVVVKIEQLKNDFDVQQYGALSYAVEKYPLFIIKTPAWDVNKPTILITGGVHGYETSGVHGAIRFIETEALKYAAHFNIVTAPCISPWGYETINRWNPNTVDPNRSFYPQSPSEEAATVMKVIAELNCSIISHIDLHETTDTDNTEFRPALAARDAEVQDNWNIPDGFYCVGDTEFPADDFQSAVIASVEKVTHIAPPDEHGKIIGETLVQNGVINYPTRKLGLCSGFTDSQCTTTTEVYPDSPYVTDEDCINAQVAAIKGGLDYLRSQ